MIFSCSLLFTESSQWSVCLQVWMKGNTTGKQRKPRHLCSNTSRINGYINGFQQIFSKRSRHWENVELIWNPHECSTFWGLFFLDPPSLDLTFSGIGSDVLNVSVPWCCFFARENAGDLGSWEPPGGYLASTSFSQGFCFTFPWYLLMPYFCYGDLQICETHNTLFLQNNYCKRYGSWILEINPTRNMVDDDGEWHKRLLGMILWLIAGDA